jgi:cytochrome c oxidase subunit 4
MEHNNIQQHIKKYLFVFAALMVFTIITVVIASFHLSTAIAITLALIVASIKGTMVASYFMHLISEKKTIFIVLAFTIFFLLGLLFLPTLTEIDSISRNVS